MDRKQVYEVRVEITVYVVAETMAEARSEGIYAVKHGDESSAFEVDAEPVDVDLSLSRDVARSLPYNAPRDHRRDWRVEQWQAASQSRSEEPR